MISDAPISSMPSFRKIILDKIESARPILKRSKHTSLSQDNIHLPVFVFEGNIWYSICKRIYHNAIISDSIEEQFRMEAIKRFGVRKWNLSKALEQAMDLRIKKDALKNLKERAIGEYTLEKGHCGYYEVLGHTSDRCIKWNVEISYAVTRRHWMHN